MPDICYGAYNHAFIPEVEAYAKTRDIKLHTVVYDPKRPESLIEGGAKVVIARGLTARKIRHQTSLAVAEIPIFFDDIAQAIIQASKISNRIAIVSYSNFITKLDELNPLLQVEIIQMVLKDETELYEAIGKLKSDGIQVIIGGKSQTEVARELGIQSIVIPFSERALDHAFNQAQILLHAINRENRKQEELRAVLDNSEEGFIAVDEALQITLLNRKAATLLATEENHLVGMAIGDAIPELLLLMRTITSGEPQVEQVMELRGITILYNVLPLRIGDRIIGATILFRELSEVALLQLEARKQLIQRGFFAKYHLDHIIGNSPAIEECKRRAIKYAAADSGIFIIGETGVGKELFAQSIHNASDRRKEPFVAINCSTLPENILESELFGYEKGSFTGALEQGKPGLFELAHRGTIFLDEITEMSTSFQARLLRVLQERQILRIGGKRLIPIDVRVITATNIKLADILAKKHIRADLFYRINVLTLNIPPLRERQSDIPALIERFYPELYRKQLSSEAMQPLLAYDWPGNVRQLLNFLEKLAVLSEGQPISGQALTTMLHDFEGSDQRPVIRRGTPSKGEIVAALAENDYHQGQTSEALGIHRSTLWRLMKKYQI